jgi:septum formation protein
MPVLAADTTVALGNEMLAKPADAADAVRMLRSLSGTRHRVLTAVAVALDDRVAMRVNESFVTFCTLDAARIEAYVATGEPFDKAGGYGIQGRAGAFVERLEGSHSGVMGLPLHETTQLLREFGVAVP